MTECKFFSHVRETVSRLYLGSLYPVIIGACVLLGHAFAIELYLCILSAAITSLGLCFTKRARPLIFFFISFAFQISRKNSPGIPEPSDYYFTSFRAALLALIFLAILASIVYYAVSIKLFSLKSLKSLPLLSPLCVLSLAFITNGFFSGKWNSSNLVFGILEAVCFTLFFVFFYLALEREKEGLYGYFVYSCAVLSVVLVCEVLWCYLTADSIIKENIVFGWGIWNTAGVALTVLIPTSLLGFARKSNPVYLCVAVLTLVGVFLTMSRNAMLVSIIVSALSFVAFAIYNKKRVFGISALGLGLAAFAFGFIIFGEAAVEMLKSFFDDNGRFALWQMGIDNFLSAPIFGVGFYGADFGTFFTAEFLPTMAHQTFIQLLSAMGIFGLLAYLYYRVCTVIPFVKGHSFEKTMLGISALALLFESCLDNFVLFFLPTFHYTVLLVIVFVNGTKQPEDK